MLISLVLAAPAQARVPAGSLDLSFGQRGKVLAAVDLGVDSDSWRSADAAMARLPDGKIAVLVGKTLRAFRADGKVASSFGGGAFEVTPPLPGTVRLAGLATAPGGTVIVAGTYVHSAGSPLDEARALVFLARYRPDGSLDPSFGNGGVVLTDLGFPSPRRLSIESPSGPMVELDGIVVDSQGRIVVGGNYLQYVDSCRTWSFGYREAFAARLLSNGEPDPSFGSAGVTTVPEAESLSRPALTRGDGVYLAGEPKGPCYPPYNHYLVRLGKNGQRVSSFATDGVLNLLAEEVEAPPAVTVDADGRVLLLRSDFNLRRVLPDGQLDPEFGASGTAAVPPPAASFAASALLVDRFGGILVAGASYEGYEPSLSAFAISRLTARGRLDRRFGSGGVVETRFGGLAAARATSMKLLPRGRVLVAGPLARPSLPGGEGLALARYLNR